MKLLFFRGLDLLSVEARACRSILLLFDISTVQLRGRLARELAVVVGNPGEKIGDRCGSFS